MPENGTIVAGIDVGTECVKVIVLEEPRTVLGRAVVPTKGYFQERAREALDAALDDAQLSASRLSGICATGFGSSLVAEAGVVSGETACHALGAFYHHPQTIDDIVNHSVGRVLDLFDLDSGLLKRWEGPGTRPAKSEIDHSNGTTTSQRSMNANNRIRSKNPLSTSTAGENHGS